MKERGVRRGGGTVGERQREVKEVGEGEEQGREKEGGREGEQHKHRGVGGTDCSGEPEERGR